MIVGRRKTKLEKEQKKKREYKKSVPNGEDVFMTD